MSRRRDLDRAAAYVAARRGELSLTQAALATSAGVDIKTIYSLESAKRWPQAGNRSAIEAALGWQQGDLAKIAEANGEPTPPLVRPTELESQWELPLPGIRAGATATMAEVATVRRFPLWFIREADRRSVAVEDLDQSLEVLRHMAQQSGLTLAEFLLHAGLTTAKDLEVAERPDPPVESEALEDFDHAAARILSSPFLKGRKRKEAEAAIAQARKEIEENISRSR